MKRYFLAILLLVSFNGASRAQTNDSTIIRSIYTETLAHAKAYEWLRDLCTRIGGRLSGSPEAAKAVIWAKEAMMDAGADTVWLQEVWVPHWVRGAKETGTIIDGSGLKQHVPVCALGGSVATSKKGITAQVIEVNSFEQLEKLGEQAIKGKIVFFNHPFDTRFINTFNAYGEAVEYRWRGPSEAARYGAIASIVRSMTLSQDDYPHTGAMHYADSLPKIPCCAISTNGANLLSSIIKADKKTSFYLQMNCATLDSVLSYNVIGELRGTVYPDEYITVGGHLDSWETGDGAHDDGAGVVQSIEVLRTFKALGLKPKRTIRAVAFMNEENGTKGGKKYASEAKRKAEKHVVALESDAGGTAPFGFGLLMPELQKQKVLAWAPLFRPYNLWDFDEDHGGADISYLEKELDVPQMGLVVESQRYFDYHHAGSDTFDKINKRELLLGAASLAAMIHLLSTYGL